MNNAQTLILIMLNGKSIEILPNIHLENFLQQQYHCAAHFAVAVNQTFIPRSQHSKYVLQSGDEVEIVFPMQRG